MEHYGRNLAGEDPRLDPDTGLEESMWRLGLGGSRGSGRGGGDFAYPERPGEMDCAYYMRTGTCGYGERCRYNHPRDPGAVFQQGGEAIWSGTREYPDRVGQPLCQYYMKTGTCKFGSTCKFHHPRQAGSRQPVSLNYYGYPLRSGEKECSYYMKTGQCKFGSTCKFHHPQPVGASVASPAPLFYPTVQPPSAPSPQQYTQAGGWQIGRPSSALTGAYMQGSYGPMVLSPGVVRVPGWSPYLQPSLGQSVSPSAQQSIQAGTLYGPATQLSPLAPAYPGPYPTVSSPVGPSSSTQKEHIFPERPGQPECQFYMRTGDCKFGATCKYHHPLDWRMPRTNSILSPMGLPLRPGAQVCTYYVQHGVCKFGPTCKFDHPMGTLSYSPSASSLVDMPVAPYPIGISLPTLAPSSSSTELRPEFLTGKDPFSTQAPSSEDTHSGSVSSLLTKGRFLPHSLMQSSSQMSAASSSSTKITSSS